MQLSDALGLCAEGESDLQRVLHAGLGSRWVVEDGLGHALDGVPHPYLLGAVTLRPGIDVARLTPVAGTVCDSYAELTLPGREAEPENALMVREPGALPATPEVAGLGIRVVEGDAGVVTWEDTAFRANGAPPERVGELHPAGSQRQDGLTLLLAELDGRPVGTCMVVVGERCATLSGVAVMPEVRGRGVGAALAARGLGVRPDLPATLGSSELGRGIYVRLGFREVGRPVHWT